MGEPMPKPKKVVKKRSRPARKTVGPREPPPSPSTKKKKAK
jgi:hypothetical protein